MSDEHQTKTAGRCLLCSHPSETALCDHCRERSAKALVVETELGGGLLGYATDAECIGALVKRVGQLETANAAVERLLQWMMAKHDAAQRLGYDAAARRYWQRVVALEDALQIMEKVS